MRSMRRAIASTSTSRASRQTDPWGEFTAAPPTGCYAPALPCGAEPIVFVIPHPRPPDDELLAMTSSLRPSLRPQPSFALRHAARAAAWLCLSLAAACSTPPAAPASTFRSSTARDGKTIFSPMDLPAPGEQRNGAGAPGQAYWQQQADYVIDARFEPETRRVEATMHVTYTNRSPDALDYVWLHLEQDVFAPDSVGARIGSRGAIPVQGVEGAGFTLGDVRSGDDVLALTRHDTLARIDLPTPLAPGGAQLAFELDFGFTLPEKVFRRFGIEEFEDGTVYEFAQWFPTCAVYDDVHGWNTLPYLGTGEFYTNFGDYTVNLTVPREYVVLATGELQNEAQVYTPEQVSRLQSARTSAETVMIVPEDEIGTRPEGSDDLTWSFQADDVRTFAWTCSDAFILDAASLDGVLLQSAYPKEVKEVWSEATQMLRTAMNDFNTRWFDYPWPVATNVCGPERGMEYPMIIFCGGAREDPLDLFGLTAHEIGHNWFPMVVNTDERRHAWMDEGFNSFICVYAREAWTGEPNDDAGELPHNFATMMLDADLLPVDTPPDHLPGRLFGRTQYRKTAAGLVLLREEILGPERFDHAFRTYIRRWAFRSPRPADFYRTMEDAAGVDLAWFWRGWFTETSWLDQALTDVRRDEATGVLQVEVSNLGELVMPVTLKLEFANGQVMARRLPVEVWAHDQRIVEDFATDDELVRVTLDAHLGLPDVDRTNNVWERPAGR